MAKNVQLFETVCSAPGKVDRETGIVHGVKFLGRQSVNGRVYSDRALADAKRLYESVVINLDHDKKDPRRERGFMEGVAFPIPETLIIKQDGIYGDLQTIKSHPAAPVFLEWAEKAANRFGLSHNAEGKENRGKNGSVIESLSKVHSVDLVRNPATTNGLFESKEPTVSKTFREILESKYPDTAKTCGLLEDSGQAALAIEVPDGGDEVLTGLKTAISAVFDDAGLDLPGKYKRLGEIHGGMAKLVGTKQESKKPDQPAADVATLQEQINAMKLDNANRELLESAGVKHTPIRLKQLAGLSAAERKEAIDDWKATDAPRPRTASPLYESRDTPAGGKIPTKGDEFAALCR